MHVHLLENPAAGRGGARTFIRAVAAALEDGGHHVTHVVGAQAGDLAEHARELGKDDADRVLIAGGDGTLKSIVNARPAPPPWPIGMIPVGTANVVARELGIPPSFGPAEVAQAILASEPWDVDLLEVRRAGEHEEWAVLAVSVGFDAEVVHAVGRAREERASTATGGYWQWVAHVVDALGSSALSFFDVSLDGGPARECALLIVQNARLYGGLFTISKTSCLDSGSLDAVGIQAKNARDVVRVLAAATVQRVEYDKQVRILSGERVVVSAASPIAVQADGDPSGFTDVEIVVKPGAMTLLRSPHAPLG